MTKHSIFTKSLIATCLLLGVVGCSSSDSTTATADDTGLAEESTGETIAEEATATDEVIEISVIIGQTSGSAVAYQAPLGSTVRITLLNPDADDEFHLHGYDIGTELTPAGQEAIIEFTADKSGSFDLESHATGEWILTLVVEE